MKQYLTCLLGLGPLAGLAQTRPLVAGQTYQAKMGEACTKTTTGGCWEAFFYHLRFGRDSVAVTWIVEAVCHRRDQPTTTRTDTTQIHHYAYHVLAPPPGSSYPWLSDSSSSPGGRRPHRESPLQRGKSTGAV